MPSAPTQLLRFDPAEHLHTEEDISIFLVDAFESGDLGYIAYAIEVASKCRIRCAPLTSAETPQRQQEESRA